MSLNDKEILADVPSLVCAVHQDLRWSGETPTLSSKMLELHLC